MTDIRKKAAEAKEGAVNLVKNSTGKQRVLVLAVLAGIGLTLRRLGRSKR